MEMKFPLKIVTMLLSLSILLLANDLEQIFGQQEPSTEGLSLSSLIAQERVLQARSVKKLGEADSFTLFAMDKTRVDESSYTYKPIKIMKISDSKQVTELKADLALNIASDRGPFISFTPSHRISCSKDGDYFMQITLDAERGMISVGLDNEGFRRAMPEPEHLLAWFSLSETIEIEQEDTLKGELVPRR